MKFQDHLIKKSMVQQKKQDLKNEVIHLEAQLKAEETINRVLRCAIDCPPLSLPYLISSFPPRVRVLLQELATVEEEILLLERRVKELKLQLSTEGDQSREWEHHLRRSSGYGSMVNGQRYRSHNFQVFTKRRITRDRRVSPGSALDIHTLFTTSRRSNECTAQGEVPRQCQTQIAIMGIQKANALSEELLKCLIGIFLELNDTSWDRKEPDAGAPKLTLSCMKSTGFACKTPSFLSDPYVLSTDPYGISSDSDCLARDVGPYKEFIHITSSSLHIDRFSQCLPAFGKLRVLINKLCEVDLNFLTNNQKLAFWINIYNACIMNAFLEQGMPSTEDEVSEVMTKAEINVGGMVLNALAIEHLILRHPGESKQRGADEKAMVVRDAYGLGYPEANVTFGLCRGTWSSPALRVYSGEEVGQELERAKAEYLEAAVGLRMRSKRKMIVPELLERQMLDFADDMESLVEWIYCHLPLLSSSLKSTPCFPIQIQPYRSHFRYLLPPSPYAI
ncbi:uncharacterized protein LOC114748455 isoform X2 [Neltuma alba]|uniref:uncharacterized protein LOC114748455 isoform X2 n=1 Tax=Neltuma alba TaxID=207710 RepID=UPI0010A3F089|nr:uncharacterized protein LOC114748455 isoform X2 [Prosopis alba]